MWNQWKHILCWYLYKCNVHVIDKSCATHTENCRHQLEIYFVPSSFHQKCWSSFSKVAFHTNVVIFLLCMLCWMSILCSELNLWYTLQISVTAIILLRGNQLVLLRTLFSCFQVMSSVSWSNSKKVIWDKKKLDCKLKSIKDFWLFYSTSLPQDGSVLHCLKVSVYPKFDHFSKKIFFAFSDRSYCNLSFKKNSMEKDWF